MRRRAQKPDPKDDCLPAWDSGSQRPAEGASERARWSALCREPEFQAGRACGTVEDTESEARALFRIGFPMNEPYLNIRIFLIHLLGHLNIQIYWNIWLYPRTIPNLDYGGA